LTDIAEATSAAGTEAAPVRKRKGSGLEAMVLPELKQLASSLGLKGSGAMRKGQLIEAIQSAQGGSRTSAPSSNGGGSGGGNGQTARTAEPRAAEPRTTEPRASEPRATETRAAEPRANEPRQSDGDGGGRNRSDNSDVAHALNDLQQTPRVQTREEQAPAARESETQPTLVAPDSGTRDTDGESRQSEDRSDGNRDRSGDRQNRRNQNSGRDGQNQARDGQNRDQNQGRDSQTQNRDQNQGRDNQGQNRDQSQNRDNQNRDQNQNRDNQSRDNSNRDNQNRDNQNRDNQNRDNQNRETSNRGGQDWDDDGGGRRGRRRRSRDRQNRRPGRTGGGQIERFDSEPTVSEDDVLVPARGILDVLDNYAFVRTSGYLPGPEDAYVSLSMVKKFALRKGDVITGAIKAPIDSDRKEKYNPLVRLDTVNGLEPEQVKNRADFSKLTPLYPQDRLKMETTPANVTGRIIDLVCPVGKGQRGLIVSPSKAGKTMIMQSIANSISTNNPEVHLMVVLVDERPEEVTDFQRAVQGEVIASTFDRPASDHTLVAELAIERAKRLVEVGRDVVVLLDGITRLGRAYNIAAPASGRILSGGVDSAALYPPKKFFGAARNIEGGGSLTILATALIETGSKMDEVIFEEFKGTGNMELRLRREFSEKRIFPAIDVDASSTRREELLMSREELAIVWKLRRVIGGLDNLQGLEMLLDRLRKTQSNGEFLMAITKSIPA
jgi:transcription termination factor Rho